MTIATAAPVLTDDDEESLFSTGSTLHLDASQHDAHIHIDGQTGRGHLVYGPPPLGRLACRLASNLPGHRHRD